MTRVVKLILFLLCLAPFGLILLDVITESLGAKPVEAITHRTGDWTLRFLLISLAVTPLRKIFGWRGLMRYRRMLGLYAFFYACLHFLTYFVLDLSFMLENIVEDVLKRPYITIGFLAFLLLVPLAVTSTDAMMRTMGKSWASLHQLIYIVAMLGVFHYLWQGGADSLEPVIYAFVLLVLLSVRVYFSRMQQRKRDQGKTTTVV